MRFWIVFLVLLGFLASPCLGQGTLDDIQRRLGKLPNKKSSKEKAYYEIMLIKPAHMQNWRRVDSRGGTKELNGIEVHFRVNRKGDDIPVPHAVCYFYDKNKNLIERKKASFILGVDLKMASPLQGDLFVKGKKRHKIAFTYASGFSFKYALCIVGDEREVSVAEFPKSAKYQEFDFDEIHLVTHSD